MSHRSARGARRLACETACGSAQFGGYTVNGGIAEFILADPNYVARIL